MPKHSEFLNCEIQVSKITNFVILDRHKYFEYLQIKKDSKDPAKNTWEMSFSGFY